MVDFESRLYSKAFKKATETSTTFTLYVSQGKLEYLAKKISELLGAGEDGGRFFVELGESSDGTQFPADIRLTSKVKKDGGGGAKRGKFVAKPTFSKRA